MTTMKMPRHVPAPTARQLLAAAAVLAAASVAGCGTAFDDPQPWCTITPITSSTHCFYRTREQCEATVSGLGGICVRNPEFFDWGDAKRRSRARR